MSLGNSVTPDGFDGYRAFPAKPYIVYGIITLIGHRVLE